MRNNNEQVFISYSHQDVYWLKRLRVHLRPLERNHAISIWDDTQIKFGSNWRQEISEAISSAKVAVLLVSADFLASDFITTNELPPLLSAAEKRGAVVLPLIISPSRFLRTNLCNFQAINDPSKPLINLSRGEQEEIFDLLTHSIEEFLNASGSLQSIQDVSDAPAVGAIADSTLSSTDILIPGQPTTIRSAPLAKSSQAKSQQITDAISVIDAKLDEAKTSREVITLDLIEDIARLAVSQGVRLYRRHLIKECADIYMYSATRLLELMRSSNRSTTFVNHGFTRGEAVIRLLKNTDNNRAKDEPLIDRLLNLGSTIAEGDWHKHIAGGQYLSLEIIKTELEKTTAACLPIVESNANRVAYQIRYAFDHIELLSQGIRRVDATISTFDNSSPTLRGLIIDVIRRAITCGSRIYNTGIKRNRDWMRSCTIIYLHTAQELLAFLETIPEHQYRGCFQVHMYLLLTVADNQTVTDENTYKVAWDIRDNFDHILSILE